MWNDPIVEGPARVAMKSQRGSTTTSERLAAISSCSKAEEYCVIVRRRTKRKQMENEKVRATIAMR